jgi:uncharacterized protein
MSDAVMAATARRIAEHAERHRLPVLAVTFHGGEPLLAGSDFLDQAARTLRRAIPSVTRLDLDLQTNGLLLNERFLDVFSRHGIRVGVSVDGSAAQHDLHRRRANGLGSHADVQEALVLLRGRPEVFGGLLCVVDPSTDPIECYEALLSHEPPWIDLLLPHATWDDPPPAHGIAGGTPYADWLITVFDRWYSSPVRATGIRMFESIIGQLLGAPSLTESLGLDPVDLVTVETDGSLEQVDSLKVAAPGVSGTGLHVMRNSMDDAISHPGISLRRQGLSALSAECLRCPVVSVCGGGLVTHRFRNARFDNRSVYCADLFHLISHIRSRVGADLMSAGARAR